MTIVNSRNFTVKIDGIEHKVLVPFADMFNHSPSNPQANWKYDNSKNGFVMEALVDIEKGD
jgi:hypothetical protein